MITVAVLTVSDSAFAGTRADISGPNLQDACRAKGWHIAATAVCPDDVTAISSQLRTWIEGHLASVVLTTGGTGVSARDVTPEATRPLLERELPGVAELIRSKGLEQTPLSPLSRGLAGTSATCFVLNLPGSPRGAVFSLEAVAHLIPHIVDLLAGNTRHG